MKNAIDWASRPPATSVLAGKPAALIGASSGPWATVRSQLHLRQVCMAAGMLVMAKPELLVPKAKDLFDTDLGLTDETTRDRLRRVLESLVAWTIRLRTGV